MSDISIRPAKRHELPEFRTLALDEIGRDYPDIDDSFADNIVRAHRNETDPIGYFTRTKTIWAGVVGTDPVGYLVGTEKRGGSVKLSPVLIKEPHRGRGYGTALWRAVEDHYRAEGRRKAYTHAPWSRPRLVRWFARLGYNLEGVLAEQYDAGQDEFVVGKFLDPPPTALLDVPAPAGIDERGGGQFAIRRFERSDEGSFRRLVDEQMSPYFDGINGDFIGRIIEARARFDQGYKAKGKAIFVLEHDDDLLGCCVGTPKRGGSVKLSPLLFDNGATETMVRELLEHVTSSFRSRGHRKVYAMVPHLRTDLIELLRHDDFGIEGHIRAPYKSGVDTVFLGKFLRRDGHGTE